MDQILSICFEKPMIWEKVTQYIGISFVMSFESDQELDMKIDFMSDLSSYNRFPSIPYLIRLNCIRQKGLQWVNLFLDPNVDFNSIWNNRVMLERRVNCQSSLNSFQLSRRSTFWPQNDTSSQQTLLSHFSWLLHNPIYRFLTEETLKNELIDISGNLIRSNLPLT